MGPNLLEDVCLVPGCPVRQPDGKTKQKITKEANSVKLIISHLQPAGLSSVNLLISEMLIQPLPLSSTASARVCFIKMKVRTWKMRLTDQGSVINLEHVDLFHTSREVT